MNALHLCDWQEGGPAEDPTTGTSFYSETPHALGQRSPFPTGVPRPERTCTGPTATWFYFFLKDNALFKNRKKEQMKCYSAPTVETQLNHCCSSAAHSKRFPRLGQRNRRQEKRRSLRASYQEDVTWNFSDVGVSQESLYID